MKNTVKNQQIQNALKQCVNNGIKTFSTIGFIFAFLFAIIYWDNGIANAGVFIFQNISQTHVDIFMGLGYLFLCIEASIGCFFVKIREKPIIKKKTKKILNYLLWFCLLSNILLIYIFCVQVFSFNLKQVDFPPYLFTSGFILYCLNILLFGFVNYYKIYYEEYNEKIIQNIGYNKINNHDKQDDDNEHDHLLKQGIGCFVKTKIHEIKEYAIANACFFAILIAGLSCIFYLIITLVTINNIYGH